MYLIFLWSSSGASIKFYNFVPKTFAYFNWDFAYVSYHFIVLKNGIAFPFIFSSYLWLVYKKAIDFCILRLYLNGLTLLGIIICQLLPCAFCALVYDIKPIQNGMFLLALPPFYPFCLQLPSISSIKLNTIGNIRHNIPDFNRCPFNVAFLW